MENKLIAVGNDIIITIDDSCGLEYFKSEKERIKIRHKNEFDNLFRPSTLIWSDKIDGSQFENLIKDLLEREPHVIRVRKISNTNERDGGVDLVAEITINKSIKEPMNEKDSPIKKINVVVQCKAFKNGVGKSDVSDIRDTIDFRNYDGYFLAVSSAVSN